MIFASPMEGTEVFEMQPTHRVSRSRRNKRRSHHKTPAPTVLCPVTGQPGPTPPAPAVALCGLVCPFDKNAD